MKRLALALALALAGCAETPTRMEIKLAVQEDGSLSGEAVTTEVGSFVPYTGQQVTTSAVDASRATDTSGGLGALLGGLLITYVTGRLGISTLTKSGRANWGVVADGDTSWKGTAWALLHNTLGTSSPPEALAKLPEPKPKAKR